MWQVLICKVCLTHHSTHTYTCIRHVTHNNWCCNDPIIIVFLTALRYEEINLLCKLGDISETHNHLMMKNLSKLKIILLVTWVSICMQYLSYENSLPLHTPTSVCIFSSLISIHLQRSWLGESVYQSKASLVGDHLLYSRELTFWFRGDIVWRN